ncbi:MAG TPA: heme ABC exporter ATP-binding protein CcmA [Acidobacteriota bacterium]|nr:heme ABC exporter ATP-binding protein CcmA [Acidobacteriota bacterium]
MRRLRRTPDGGEGLQTRTSTRVLELTRVVKRFGPVTAVRKVSLTIEKGQFLTLFGPNGAGKTTLLQLIAQLSKPTSGTLIFFDRDTLQLRRLIGYVSHQSLVYGQLSGFENLHFFARLYGLSEPAARATSMLEKMDLSRARNQLVATYSSGMKQRLTLGRALLHEPQLLLLDEPYAGLDQHGSRLLTDVLRQLKEQGRTVILITHNLTEGLTLADRVLIMRRGELMYEAARDQIDDNQFEELYFQIVED